MRDFQLQVRYPGEEPKLVVWPGGLRVPSWGEFWDAGDEYEYVVAEVQWAIKQDPSGHQVICCLDLEYAEDYEDE